MLISFLIANNLCKNYQFFLPFTIFTVFVWFYTKYFILPPCTVDVIMLGDVSEEGVIIHELAVVPTEGVLIVDVTVEAEKNKMIIFLTINVNFISYTFTSSFFKVILFNINHTCCMNTHDLTMFKCNKILIIIIIYVKYLVIRSTHNIMIL